MHADCRLTRRLTNTRRNEPSMKSKKTWDLTDWGKLVRKLVADVLALSKASYRHRLPFTQQGTLKQKKGNKKNCSTLYCFRYLLSFILSWRFNYFHSGTCFMHFQQPGLIFFVYSWHRRIWHSFWRQKKNITHCESQFRFWNSISTLSIWGYVRPFPFSARWHSSAAFPLDP